MEFVVFAPESGLADCGFYDFTAKSPADSRIEALVGHISANSLYLGD